MKIREYLHIDVPRLNSYVEQLNLHTKRVKIPKWSAKLGVLPEVTATQEEQLRDPTNHEKIEQLTHFLRQNRLLASGRFIGREVFAEKPPQFGIETTEAVKVFLPVAKPEDLLDELDLSDVEDDQAKGPFARWMPKSPAKQYKEQLERVRKKMAGFRGITLWVSNGLAAARTPAQRSAQLYLMVGFPKDDVNHVTAFSAYSALSGLFFDLKSDLQKTVLRVVSGLDLRMPSHQTEFLRDPIAWLQSTGAEVGAPRQIETLYRVRAAVLYRASTGNEAIATIAYPLFVAAV